MPAHHYHRDLRDYLEAIIYSYLILIQFWGVWHETAPVGAMSKQYVCMPGDVPVAFHM
jgi:hypothetical protein